MYIFLKIVKINIFASLIISELLEPVKKSGNKVYNSTFATMHGPFPDSPYLNHVFQRWAERALTSYLLLQAQHMYKLAK